MQCHYYCILVVGAFLIWVGYRELWLSHILRTTEKGIHFYWKRCTQIEYQSTRSRLWDRYPARSQPTYRWLYRPCQNHSKWRSSCNNWCYLDRTTSRRIVASRNSSYNLWNTTRTSLARCSIIPDDEWSLVTLTWKLWIMIKYVFTSLYSSNGKREICSVFVLY